MGFEADDILQASVW